MAGQGELLGPSLSCLSQELRGKHQRPLRVAFHFYTAMRSHTRHLATSPASHNQSPRGLPSVPAFLIVSPSNKPCNKPIKNNCHNLPDLKKASQYRRGRIGRRQNQHLTPGHLEIKHPVVSASVGHPGVALAMLIGSTPLEVIWSKL